MTVTSRSYFIGYLPLANISRAQEVTERVFKELVSLLTRKRRKKLNTVRRANLLIGENSNMSGIPADVIGEIILKMLTKYPQLFTSNYTGWHIYLCPPEHNYFVHHCERNRSGGANDRGGYRLVFDGSAIFTTDKNCNATNERDEQVSS